MTVVLEASPEQSFQDLKNNKNTVLIDVRTQAEWMFSGTPNLSECSGSLALIELMSFPDMSVNARFVEQALDTLDLDQTESIYFICKTGRRSYDAASMVKDVLTQNGHQTHCVNVLNGFEGDQNPDGRRGRVNGWKAQGLPWWQS